MAVPHPTPEQVIATLSNAELRELLVELQIESTATNAKRLRHLTLAWGDFEAAVAAIAGPAAMRRAA